MPKLTGIWSGSYNRRGSTFVTTRGFMIAWSMTMQRVFGFTRQPIAALPTRPAPDDSLRQRVKAAVSSGAAPCLAVPFGVHRVDAMRLLWRGGNPGDRPQWWFQFGEVRDRPVSAVRPAGSMAGLRGGHTDPGDARVPEGIRCGGPVRSGRRGDRRAGVPVAGSGMDRGGRRYGPRGGGGHHRRGLPRWSGVPAAVAEGS